MSNFTIKETIEFIGIIGVIGSLIFVGIEIRQNSAIAEAEAYSAFVEQIVDYNLVIASNEALNRSMMEARNGLTLEELQPEDAARVMNTNISLIRIWENIYRSVNSGVLPESSLELIGSNSFSNPAWVETWNRTKHLFSSDFGNYIEVEVRNRF